MPGFNIRAGQPVDYYLLVEPRPAGPMIGVYRDQPISQSITDYFGRSFSYDGVAPRRRDGKYDLDALKAGQFIVEPGLLYCADGRKANAQKRGLMSAMTGLAGSKNVQGARDCEKGDQSSALPSEYPTRSGRSRQHAGPPDDGRQAMRQIATTFAVCLSLAVVFHLLLAALHAG